MPMVSFGGYTSGWALYPNQEAILDCTGIDASNATGWANCSAMGCVVTANPTWAGDVWNYYGISCRGCRDGYECVPYTISYESCYILTSDRYGNAGTAMANYDGYCSYPMQCQAGYYCRESRMEDNGDSRAVKKICPEGYYCPEGTGYPISCGANYTSPAGSISASQCVYSGGGGSTTQVQCQSGYYADANCSCVPCPGYGRNICNGYEPLYSLVLTINTYFNCKNGTSNAELNKYNCVVAFYDATSSHTFTGCGYSEDATGSYLIMGQPAGDGVDTVAIWLEAAGVPNAYSVAQGSSYCDYDPNGSWVPSDK